MAPKKKGPAVPPIFAAIEAGKDDEFDALLKEDPALKESRNKVRRHKKHRRCCNAHVLQARWRRRRRCAVLVLGSASLMHAPFPS